MDKSPIINDSCYILLHRDRSINNDRTTNLISVIKYIRSELDIPILVLEQDSVSDEHLKEQLLDYNVYYQFLYNPNLFNRSWGYNCGINIVKQNKIILADNDVILNHDNLKRGLEYLNKYDIVKPFNRTYDLDPKQTQNCIENNILPSDIHNYKQRFYVVTAGGLMMIKKSAFLQSGGYDERFEGWGGEDDEMTINLWNYINNKKLTYYEFEGNLFHMYHDRTIFDGNTQPNYKNNYSYIRDNKRNHNITIGQINKYE